MKNVYINDKLICKVESSIPMEKDTDVNFIMDNNVWGLMVINSSDDEVSLILTGRGVGKGNWNAQKAIDSKLEGDGVFETLSDSVDNYLTLIDFDSGKVKQRRYYQGKIKGDK